MATTYRCETCLQAHRDVHEYSGEALMRHLAAKHETQKGAPYKMNFICTLDGIQYCTDDDQRNGTPWRMAVTDFIFEKVTVRQFKQ